MIFIFYLRKYGLKIKEKIKNETMNNGKSIRMYEN